MSGLPTSRQSPPTSCIRRAMYAPSPTTTCDDILFEAPTRVTYRKPRWLLASAALVTMTSLGVALTLGVVGGGLTAWFLTGPDAQPSYGAAALP